MSPMSDSETAKKTAAYIRVYLPNSTLSDVEEEIKLTDETKSGWVRDAINQRLERDD